MAEQKGPAAIGLGATRWYPVTATPIYIYNMYSYNCKPSKPIKGIILTANYFNNAFMGDSKGRRSLHTRRVAEL
jgi:hypothetical protein